MNHDATPKAAEAQSIARQFAERFGSPADGVWFAPGRVNLIGEHIDYSGGRVMPAAIVQGTYVALARRDGPSVRVVSSQQDGGVGFDLPVAERGDRPLFWSDYVQGVYWALADRNPPGADIAIHSTVALGAGLSSSAALEVALAKALLDTIGEAADRMRYAVTAFKAETGFVGAQCGLMDQFASAHGRAGHALLFDCASLEFESLPLPAGFGWTLVDSGVRHSVVQGDYGARSRESAAVQAALHRRLPHAGPVRDISDAQEAELAAVLDPLLARRLRHMVSENRRVLEMRAALASQDLERAGDILNRSHASMRDDYEVSCPEMDELVRICQAQPQVAGARMVGGGFGGWALVLTRAESSQAAVQDIQAAYRMPDGRAPSAMLCQFGDGVERIG